MNKNVVDKLTKLIKPNEKFPSKTTVLICTKTFEGYMALHERIFIADMLNPSLKSRLMQTFSMLSRIFIRFSRTKNFATRK